MLISTAFGPGALSHGLPDGLLGALLFEAIAAALIWPEAGTARGTPRLGRD